MLPCTPILDAGLYTIAGILNYHSSTVVKIMSYQFLRTWRRPHDMVIDEYQSSFEVLLFPSLIYFAVINMKNIKCEGKDLL